MPDPRPGTLRLRRSRLELTITTDEGRVVDVALDLTPATAHSLHHLLAARAATRDEHRGGGCTRSLVERALTAVGAAPERLEVRPGRLPDFRLVVVCADGARRRVTLDVADVAELAVTRRIPTVAIGWPHTDWDGALRELLDP